MIGDALTYVCRPRRPDEKGGEWDMIRSWPKKHRRILTGAGLLGQRYGDPPDVVALQIRYTHGLGSYDDCEILDMWRKEALRLIRERRRDQHHWRHHRVARRHGFPTYHAYRAHLYGCSVHTHAKKVKWR